MYHLPLGDLVSHLVAWLLKNYGGLFDGFSAVTSSVIQVLRQSLSGLPWWLVILLIVIIAWKASGWKLALGSAVGLFLIYNLQLWGAFIDTVVLVVIATIVSILIGIPLGILTALKPRVNSVVEPVMDFMQTMPSFVYLIPALMFFGLGIVPAAFATVVFSMPPAIRLTRLGITQVPVELVEVGTSFGSTPAQLLWKIQLPLALPTIMAGINQTMMLSLSMVVIAAMIGAGGFGQGVLAGISQMDIGKGFENGLAVVILAMILERISSGFFKGTQSQARKVAAGKKYKLLKPAYVWPLIAALLVISLSAGYFNSKGGTLIGNAKKETVTIGYVNWQEDVAVTYLWKEILSEKGYNVELKSLDVAPLYVGLSKGNLDLFLDGWLPVTQKVYWEKYKSQLVDYGSWYKGEAKLGLIVPKYVTITSIAQLEQEKARFGGQIIGIDPGAGIMKSADKAIKDYQLTYKLVPGSEAAMIASLDKSYRENKWIVITGWSPHWIFAKYDLKYLTDEKKSFGGSEGLHMLANNKFARQQPEIGTMLGKFRMNDKQIGGLEDMIQKGMDPQQAARLWIKQNKNLVNSWTR